MSHSLKNISFIDLEVKGVKPHKEGWMWVPDGNPFDHFSNEISHYLDRYKQNCKQFKVAVQAGGHMGVFPRMMSEIFETVYTFEPDLLSFHCLTNNCFKKNIIKFNTALGDGSSLLYQSHYYYGNVGMNNYKVPADNSQPYTEFFDREYKKEPVVANIPQIAIDDLNLTDCDLVHLDMEGNEHYAFRGMIKTIEKFKPFILFEGGPDEETFNYIKSLGYDQLSTFGDSSWVCR
jgi:FkbM family methyltransferase